MLSSPVVPPIVVDARMQDPLVLALHYSSVRDILSLGQTCKAMWELCLTKQIWMLIWRRDVLQANLPYPLQTISLDLLSGSQMKTLVTHTLMLHRCMTDPTYRSPRKALIPQSQSITWVRLIGAAWLLVATSSSSSSILSLYSVETLLDAAPRGAGLVTQAFLHGPVLNGLVEVSSQHGVVILLELRTPTSTLDVLSIQSHGGSLAFVQLARHEGISHLQAAQGSSIAFSLHDDLSVPSLLDWTTGSVLHLRLSPDPDGSAVTMALNGGEVALLTPRKLMVMRQSVIKGHSQYATTAALAVNRQVGQAIMSFCGDGDLQVFISNSDGAYGYLIRRESIVTTQGELEHFLVWVHEPEITEFERTFGFAMRPHVDKSSNIVSWLENLHTLSPGSCPVRIMTTTHTFSGLAPSNLQNTPLFTLSEREMPALYALSVRDYDAGLGLLAVGNMIGELGLYSLSGGALHDVQGILQRVPTLGLCGQELLPQLSFTPYPPRPMAWYKSCLSTETGKRRNFELWGEYWPADLEIPNSWHRATPFDENVEYCFSDCIGNPSWELEYGCHFLGRPIPLLKEQHTQITLFKAGGLFLLHIPNSESEGPTFGVLDPNLTLENIVSLLPEHPDHNTLQNLVVDVVCPDCVPGVEISRLILYGRWEARHDIWRWRDFQKRCGEVDDDWSENYVFNTPIAEDVYCANCRHSTWTCPCTALLSKYYPRQSLSS